MTKVINADGQESTTITSKADQEIAKLEGPLADGSYATFWSYFDGAQRLIKTIPPNGVQEIQSGTGDGDKWATKNTYDFIGNIVLEDGPDMGTNQYIYDLLGEVRFTLMAKNQGTGINNQDIIIYQKYDVQGRVYEVGYFEADWNAEKESLTAIALTDPDYPGTSLPSTKLNVFNFDGDGSDPSQFGRMISASAFNQEGILMVTTDFKYDLQGNLLQKSILAASYDPDVRVLTFAYNNLNNLKQITFPSGSTLPILTYQFNKLGQVFRLGDGTVPDAIATFFFNAEGAIIQSTLTLENSLSILRQSDYNAPGWPLKTEFRLNNQTLIFSEELSYVKGGYENAAYFDGKIAEASYIDADGDASAHKFKYDKLARILTAQNTGDTALNLGVTKPLEYDANGNLLSMSRGGKQSVLNYEDSADKLISIEEEGVENDTFQYDDGGNTRVADNDQDLARIDYQLKGNLITAIDIGPNAREGIPNSRLEFNYDASDARTVKKHLDTSGQELSAKIYLRGENNESLFEQERTSGSTTDAQYLYGPDGLTGMIKGDKRYAVVKDHLGSVRQVIDGSGAIVASFDYTPFGITITKAGSTQPDIIFYRYTGQELDSETKLYNFFARMYDPESARFLSVDPKKVGGTPYAYVLNNPSNLIDPDGEEPLTAFLIAVIVGAIIGAAAGAITYAVTHAGSFNVGEFFAYTAVGLVAGALGGAAAYGGGVLATAGLAAAGVQTSTSIGSGIVVGAVAGAADGVVSGSLNQIGVNLIEGRPAGEGVGLQALIGFGAGLAAGGIAGGITGKLHAPTARNLADPNFSISGSTNSQNYAVFKGATELHGPVGAGGTRATLQGSNFVAGDVVTLGGHGLPRQRVIDFSDVWGTNSINADTIAADLNQGGAFGGSGIDLTAVCYPGRNGVARTLANDLNVPVRAARTETFTYGNGATYAEYSQRIAVKSPIRTYYPSKLKTGWIALFGY